MTPEEKKAKMFAKLNEPAEPVITQVVRVEDVKKTGRPEKVKAEETEHMNAYPTESLAADMRIYKARTKKSLIDIMNEAFTEYLEKRGALTVK